MPVAASRVVLKAPADTAALRGPEAARQDR
jgi:hypothetical protein